MDCQRYQSSFRAASPPIEGGIHRIPLCPNSPDPGPGNHIQQPLSLSLEEYEILQYIEKSRSDFSSTENEIHHIPLCPSSPGLELRNHIWQPYSLALEEYEILQSIERPRSNSSCTEKGIHHIPSWPSSRSPDLGHHIQQPPSPAPEDMERTCSNSSSIPSSRTPDLPDFYFPTSQIHTPSLGFLELPLVNQGSLHLVNQEGVPLVNQDSVPLVNQGSLPLVNQDSVPLVNQDSVPLVNQGSLPLINQDDVPMVNQESNIDAQMSDLQQNGVDINSITTPVQEAEAAASAATRSPSKGNFRRVVSNSNRRNSVSRNRSASLSSGIRGVVFGSHGGDMPFVNLTLQDATKIMGGVAQGGHGHVRTKAQRERGAMGKRRKQLHQLEPAADVTRATGDDQTQFIS
ncbi:hypothetical protein L211DRAFT_835342 [Terfezia boudieri ATCC MYA-4762]|uniref:Uncharacterized protein n=1 Tax=Terfezia boudieri ATCC MYA-4762 TaxID=1051890 RepID=A0A3N4M0R0_9PEZI|nr:hypothetical protein L211DRAFT_835342 [Terfezia boudieri ATCC MYA-4762]